MAALCAALVTSIRRSVNMNHLMNVLDGITSVLDWATSSRPYVVQRGGFALDQKRLKDDARRVGNDMQKAINRYGRQPRTPGKG